MASRSAVPDPGAFGLTSFADLLPARDPIIGEIPGAFQRFRAAMMVELAPATPYECVIAENLDALEWEMLQHRRMRRACISEVTRHFVRKAVVEQREAEYKAEMEAAYKAHIEAGGSEDDWKAPSAFNSDVANLWAKTSPGGPRRRTAGFRPRPTRRSRPLDSSPWHS